MVQTQKDSHQINIYQEIEKKIECDKNLPWDLPKLASYVCIYSDVMNCETSAVLPVPASPIITTRYLQITFERDFSFLIENGNFRVSQPSARFQKCIRNQTLFTR